MPDNARWHGAAFKAMIRAETGRRLDAVRFAVADHAKKLIGVEGAAKGPKGKLAYGATRSKPGEPPRKQYGRLQSSVASERVGLVARVGTNLKYGRALEMGTAKMAARPWLRRSLNEMTAFIRAVFARPIG